MADSLYDRLGGIDAITAVVGSFRDRVAGDDRINLKFARTDLARLTKMSERPNRTIFWDCWDR